MFTGLVRPVFSVRKGRRTVRAGTYLTESSTTLLYWSLKIVVSTKQTTNNTVVVVLPFQTLLLLIPLFTTLLTRSVLWGFSLLFLPYRANFPTHRSTTSVLLYPSRPTTSLPFRPPPLPVESLSSKPFPSHCKFVIWEITYGRLITVERDPLHPLTFHST